MSSRTSDFDQLRAFVPNNVSELFIRHIRFPKFKNLEAHTKIAFEYPITALVGPNGTNKSSILRALQGCPNQYNIGDYWFDTPLDRIVDDGPSSITDPHRYIHGYVTPSGYMAEVIKARVGKTARGLDYFETSAPRIRDAMAAMPSAPDPKDSTFHNKTRWRPIEKDVVYLDFRQELPAYDILFHFNWRKKPNDIEWKKRQIRKGGPHVSQALEKLETVHRLYNSNRILEPADQLTDQEISDVGLILERDYKTIRLVRHDFFGVEGYTANLTTKKRSYSEAYAGSGEFATIMLVRAISRAPAASLILLDEPETSLHPGAQKALMRFIARMCILEKHQVILATHSPAMVEELPDDARKLLDLDRVSGQVRVVSQSASIGEAFTRVGASFSPRTIIVEDELAKAFVMRAARMKGEDFVRSIEVICVPGGADTLVQRVVPVEAQMDSTCTLLLDGDKRPSSVVKSTSQVVDTELQAELDKVNIPEKSIIHDGGTGGSKEQLLTQQRKTLAWVNKHLQYLPGKVCPDALLLTMDGEATLTKAEAESLWVSRARNELGFLGSEYLSANQILDEQRRVLKNICDSHPVLMELLEALNGLALDES